MSSDSSEPMNTAVTGEPVRQRAPETNVRVLRLPEVCKVTGLCRSSIYQMEAERRFPRRVKVGLRAVGWIEGEVSSWLRGRIADSRSP